MPTEVSPKVKMIAVAELERMQKAEEELARLKKYSPKAQVPTARIRLSRFHDFEAYIQFFAKDEEGKLVKDEKGFYLTDATMKTLYFNTTQMRDLLDGKAKAVTVTEPQEE